MGADRSAFIWIASGRTFASFIEELEIVLGVNFQRYLEGYDPSEPGYIFYGYTGDTYCDFIVDNHAYDNLFEHFGNFTYVIQVSRWVDNPQEIRERILACAQAIFEKLKACQKYHLLLTQGFSRGCRSFLILSTTFRSGYSRVPCRLSQDYLPDGQIASAYT